MVAKFNKMPLVDMNNVEKRITDVLVKINVLIMSDLSNIQV